MIRIIKNIISYPNRLLTVLYQIYGELNRIRLIIGEKSKRGKEIEEFDKKNNSYFPYFGSEKEYKKYQTLKGQLIKKKK